MRADLKIASIGGETDIPRQSIERSLSVTQRVGGVLSAGALIYWAVRAPTGARLLEGLISHAPLGCYS